MFVRPRPARPAAGFGGVSCGWLLAGLLATGCEGNATVVGPDGPPPATDYAATDDPATPTADTPSNDRPPPSVVRDDAPRREERRPDRRAERRPDRRDGGRGVAPRGETVAVPGADPFDPEIDPATLTRPEPVAPPAAQSPPELKNFPLTAAIPPDREAIPADLALPAGTTLYYQDGRDWAEVELKADAPPAAADAGATGEAPALRVRRTDRPAVIPDVRIPHDQLVISKRAVRRLRNAR